MQTTPHWPQLLLSLFVSLHVVPVPAQSLYLPLQTHCELSQIAPVWQTLPHAPQLALSVARLMQTPASPQFSVGGAQVHVPLVQDVPPLQVVAHEPQFELLDERSTHAPVHAVSAPPSAPASPEHVAAQAPRLHTWPALHFVTHAPQWVGSLWRSTQTPPQLVWPAGQVQTPFVQSKPAAQTFPQAPQLFGSVERRTHWPPHATLPFDTDASWPWPAQPPATHAPL